MRIFMYYESSLPDCTFSGNEGLSRLQKYLSEKNSRHFSACMGPVFVLNWSVFQPDQANLRAFFVVCDIREWNRISSAR